MKHVTKFQKSIFVSLAVLGFVGGMQMSDIINSGDESAIPTIKAASVRRGQQIKRSACHSFSLVAAFGSELA